MQGYHDLWCAVVAFAGVGISKPVCLTFLTRHRLVAPVLSALALHLPTFPADVIANPTWSFTGKRSDQGHLPRAASAGPNWCLDPPDPGFGKSVPEPGRLRKACGTASPGTCAFHGVQKRLSDWLCGRSHVLCRHVTCWLVWTLLMPNNRAALAVRRSWQRPRSA